MHIDRAGAQFDQRLGRSTPRLEVGASGRGLEVGLGATLADSVARVAGGFGEVVALGLRGLASAANRALPGPSTDSPEFAIAGGFVMDETPRIGATALCVAIERALSCDASEANEGPSRPGCAESRSSAPPDRARCAPLLPESEIGAILAHRTMARSIAIDALVAEAAARGESLDRIFLAMMHDFERAPLTTNKAQLAEIGVHCPDAEALPKDPEEVERVLWTIIYGLERLHVYLLGTDHLTDRALLERLVTGVLVDEVHDLPPSEDASEFIDFGFEGAFDVADGDDEAVDAVDQTPIARCTDDLKGPYELAQDLDSDEVDDMSSPIGDKARGEHGERPQSTRIVRRDHLLPKPPSWGARTS